MAHFASIPFKEQAWLDIEEISGTAADPDSPFELLVEVPHGADRRAHYDALRSQLVGTFPDELEIFFHVNTDVGAWHLGRAIAAQVVAARPSARALVVRSLIPRTFVDCNRVIEAMPRRSLAQGGMTPGLPPYVKHPSDRALLIDLHTQYVSAAQSAFAAVCGAGGLALIPHTYGPRTLPIEAVDENIVANLRRAHEPEILATAPWRPKVDLITRTKAGEDLAPEGAWNAVREGLAALDIEAKNSETYFLHPATQGHRFTVDWPGQVLGFEVRRDLLVEAWTPFEEQVVDEARVEPIADVFADYATAWLAENWGRGQR